MHRRTLLSAVAAGSVTLAGCAADEDDGDGGGGGSSPEPDTTEDPSDLPNVCPTSQDLGVEWPTDLDTESVATFVERYEAAYYRNVVVDFDPDAPFTEYSLDGELSEPPEQVDGGWELTYTGSGAVYNANLALSATATDAPDDADLVDVEAFERHSVTAMVRTAAEEGSADDLLTTSGVETEQQVERFASLSDDFEAPTERGDSDTMYADVDGTTVELSVSATSFHGDYWWTTQYYVDERVVRRAEGEDADPQEGTVLECREG